MGPFRFVPQREEFTSSFVAVDADSQVSIDAAALVYIKLEKAAFNLPVHLPDGSSESIHVTRWNLPLSHAMVRTAMSSQGLTFVYLQICAAQVAWRMTRGG